MGARGVVLIARGLASWPARAPKAACLLALAILALASVGGTRIAIEADSTTAFDSPASRALDRIRRDLGAGEDLFVLVEATSDEGLPHLERFAAALAADLVRESGVAPLGDALDLEHIVGSVVPAFGASYLSAAEAHAWAAPTPAFVDERVAAALARADLPGLGRGDGLLELDPLGLAGPVLSRLGAGGLPASMASGVSRSLDGRAALLKTAVRGSSSDPASAREAIAMARRVIAARAQDPGAPYLACHVVGGHAIAAESERIVRRDLVITLSTSLALAFVLVGYGFSFGLGGALLLGVPVVWGTAVGVGLQGFLQPGGRIPAMALACAGVLIGLGIDFAIHATGAAAGRSGRELVEVWPGLARRLGLATLTTIGAFATFALASQPALRAMGAIATTGIVACWLGALLLMPALLATRPFSGAHTRGVGAAQVSGWAHRHPGQALGATAALSVSAIFAIGMDPPRIEDDLSRMHAVDSPPLMAQRKIVDHFGRAAEPLLVVLEATDVDAASEACHRLEPAFQSLRTAGVIAGHFSPAHLLPSRAAQDAAAVALAGAPALASGVSRAALVETIARALDANGLDAGRLEGYVTAWVEALGRGAGPVGPRDLEGTPLGGPLRTLLRATGSGATAMVVVIPAASLWDARARAAVVGPIERALAGSGVRGDVTGMNVIAAEAARLVATDLMDVSGATLGMVVAILFVQFRRPIRVALVLLPAALATLWTAGLLAATGIRLNMMNLGVLPLVLAIGVDDGIHLVDHWLAHAKRDVLAVIARTGTPIAITSLTTMASFGSLACSELRGLASVGWLVLFGVGAALIATLVALPAVLGIAERRAARE